MQRNAVVGFFVSMAFSGAALAGPLVTGPNSSQTPYQIGVGNVGVTSILSVGDTADNGYRMVGIPDGMGVIDNGSTFSLFMNHELGATAGVTRAHGSKGAFISEWLIRKSDLRVLSGQDLMSQVYLWNSAANAYQAGTTAFNRFCSADLAPPSAFYNSATGMGTQSRIFMNGEEAGAAGRAFANIVSGADKGKSFQLPALGNASWENQVASPFMQDKTIIMGMDDTSGGRVSVYIGNKQASGSEVERAGLSNGQTFSIKVNGVTTENRNPDAGLGLVNKAGTFTLVAGSTGGTGFLRPEDGAWDPTNPNRFYFVTTDQLDTAALGTGSTQGRSRLWAITFTDIKNPELGGKVDLMIDGTGTIKPQMMDNITVGTDGAVTIQEDPGNTAYSAKTWRFDPVTRQLTQILGMDIARFGTLGTPATAPYNVDEENSGVIDVTSLFDGVAGYDTAHHRYFLTDTQAHYGLPGELVEGGQLQLVRVAVTEPHSVALLGLVALPLLGFVRRRRNV